MYRKYKNLLPRWVNSLYSKGFLKKIMLEILFALGFGIIFGLVAGLLPGLHPNNTIPIILGMTFLFSPLTASIVLISSGVVNIFINFIPSILLGAPEDASILSVLPGHRLLLEGKGFDAIKLSVMGAFGGVLFSIAMLPLFSLFIPTIYDFIRPYIHFILIPVVAYMIIKEKGFDKLIALIVFLLSGFLGLIVLDYSDAMLFPLLSGLFGLPTLIIAIKSKTSLPKKFEETKEKMKLIKPITIGGLSGILAGLLPGLGSAQSTALTQQVFRDGDKSGKNFLVSVGAVASSDLVYSLFALYLIGNPRSGIAVAVSKLMEIGFNELMMFVIIILISACIGLVLTLKLTHITLHFLRKVNYSRLCLYTTIFILVLIFLFSGVAGLIVAAVATSIGMIANYTNVKRTHSMGCLLLPTILWFAGIKLI
ncbi:MAG: tripartite tricarboxylate transporter permease [Candidatus Aenigmarchaeota archaeon]|nr:tripartite tricarboxylate transporter permease [Candidatus Aenigmarchaeota archaeon]